MRLTAIAATLAASAALMNAPAYSQTAADPVALVDPFVGTAGTQGVGLIDDYPGASAPFGMLQWSPDTPTLPPSGGYFYRDKAISGFSLTHVSGAGCFIYGDFAVLPTLGEIRNPGSATQPFLHAGEAASPGYYAVSLGEPAIRTRIAVTPRTGIAEFTFPAGPRANLLIDTASDQAGVTDARFHVVGPDEVAGSATSGGFCGMPNVYTVYFDMRFDRPFSSYGTWKDAATTPGGSTVSGPHSGGWVTFDATGNPTVRVKAAVSYVSERAARDNLIAEATSWSVDQVHAATASAWRSLLGEVRISGGTPAEQRMLYTSLYHALLSPTLFSDADGAYRGFDGGVHRGLAGHAQYANFSGWDIYRTQVPLMALLAPRQTGDMMESLVHDAQQGGWLPKWPAADGYTGVMGGDSADPIIAAAYAFGARDFDRIAALRAMIKNADDARSALGQQWFRPRPGLAEYLQRGYVVNSHTTSVSPVPNGASETLEYALDDFSIAQFAHDVSRPGVYRRFMRRSTNWATLFDESTGAIAPRDADGAFMRTPITANGQSGFQEGNSAQYTWMVPQALGSLVAALGGTPNALGRLDAFFSKLDAGQDQPYAWFGNEPTLGSPWTYLYAGAPYRAQAVNRAVMLSLYAPTPDGIPGNDDLGTMSAWWVWNALGLYPINPSVPVLLLETPLFSHVTIASPSGRRIDVDAPAASDTNKYLQSLRVNGAAANRAWVVLPQRGTLALDEVAGATPNVDFGRSPQDAPPNYTPGLLHFPPSTAAGLGAPARMLDLPPGTSAPLAFTVTNLPGGAATQVSWTAQSPANLSVSPPRGRAEVGAAAVPVQTIVSAAASTLSGLYNVVLRAVARNGAPLAHAAAVVRVARAGQTLPLAYAANFSDDTIVPIDLRTHAYGNAIPVGNRPGDLAVGSGGARAYSANQGSNDVSVVDTAAQKTVAAIKVGKVPAGIRLTPDGKALWVTNYGDGTVQRIDTATLRAGAPIAVGSQPEELAIAPDGSRLYVADQGSNQVSVLDIAAGKVIATIGVGDHPIGIAVSPDGKRIYVSNAVSNDVSAIDASSLAVLARIPVGKAPQGMAFSPDGSQSVRGRLGLFAGDADRRARRRGARADCRGQRTVRRRLQRRRRHRIRHRHRRQRSADDRRAHANARRVDTDRKLPDCNRAVTRTALIRSRECR